MYFEEFGIKITENFLPNLHFIKLNQICSWKLAFFTLMEYDC